MSGGFTVQARRVMVERRHGWEGASPGLLALVFGVSVQRATAITNERCAACNLPICGHSDAQWAGEPDQPLSPSAVSKPASTGVCPGPVAGVDALSSEAL